MNRRRLLVLAVVAALAAGAFVALHRGREATHYTGFVEGDERIVRAEVAGRVLETPFHEGDRVPAGAVVARLDDADIAARVASKQRELGVLEAQIARQRDQVTLTEATWRRDVSAREAELRQAQAEAELARATHRRQSRLAEEGVASRQQLDEARSRNDSTQSVVERARDVLGRTRAMEAEITLERRQADVLEEQLALARAQLAELEVEQAKYQVHAPDTGTTVQAQLAWPGELAQPGTPIVAVLDPLDKYVQIYVPVGDADRVRVGTRVEIELDSEPGRRVPGEVSFVADQANFTPEKIETRSDRLGQVFRAKVRILEGVERFQPGTEGDVHLVDGGGEATTAAR